MTTQIRQDYEVQPVKLITVAEAAGRLGISRSLLYRSISSGALKSVRIGASRRISEKSLNAFVEALETESPHDN